jgi:hypothetical protein
MAVTTTSSTALTDVDYDEDTRELTITFRDGSSYTYHGVPADVYSRLLDDSSKGWNFNTFIRNGYAFTRN